MLASARPADEGALLLPAEELGPAAVFPAHRYLPDIFCNDEESVNTYQTFRLDIFNQLGSELDTAPHMKLAAARACPTSFKAPADEGGPQVFALRVDVAHHLVREARALHGGHEVQHLAGKGAGDAGDKHTEPFWV